MCVFVRFQQKFIAKYMCRSFQLKEHQSMARKKTNQVPTLSHALNVRVPSLLENEIRSVCKRHDLSISHFGRRAFQQYLATIKDKPSLFEGAGQ